MVLKKQRKILSNLASNLSSQLKISTSAQNCFTSFRTLKVALNRSEGSERVLKTVWWTSSRSFLKEHNFCVSHEKKLFFQKNNVKY